MVQRAQERVSAIPRNAIISERSDVPDAQPTILLVLTYHPTNALVKNIMNRNFHLLRDDPDTRDIYQPVRVLCAYRRDKNLRDSLLRSDLNNTTASVEDRGTFPCGRSRCNTCAHTNASPTINTPVGHITINFPSTPVQATAWYISSNVVPATRYTSERQDDSWEIDSGNTYVQHNPTPIFPLVDILHHQDMPLLICWYP